MIPIQILQNHEFYLVNLPKKSKYVIPESISPVVFVDGVPRIGESFLIDSATGALMTSSTITEYSGSSLCFEIEDVFIVPSVTDVDKKKESDKEDEEESSDSGSDEPVVVRYIAVVNRKHYIDTNKLAKASSVSAFEDMVNSHNLAGALAIVKKAPYDLFTEE